MKHTLITGGSMGIGKALAMECASRGMNLVLVALDTPDLYETAAIIKEKYDVDIHCIAQDITAEGGPLKVREKCSELGIDVVNLINNAGRGNSGIFEENRLDDYLQIIDLNNRAMVQVTYHFIKDIKNAGSGHIMNVSSMEATMPLPYKAVYTATKNFIYAFSMALSEELRKSSNVKVSILCPGSVITNTGGDERIKAQGSKSKIIRLSAEKVAVTAIEGMLKGQRMIVPGKAPWFIVNVMNWVPVSLKMKILEKLFRVYAHTGSLHLNEDEENNSKDIDQVKTSDRNVTLIKDSNP